MARNIYTGPSSCWGIYEGVYVNGHGVDLVTGVTHLYLMLKELERGWTYDKHCNRIPMTWDRFKDRARYLIALCYAHQPKDRRSECVKLKEVVRYVIKHRRLPEWAMGLIRLGYNEWARPPHAARVGVPAGHELPAATAAVAVA